jgi:DNA-binding MarR family transcriptional regulator
MTRIDKQDRQELTPAQEKVLIALVRLIGKNGFQPSVAELGEELNSHPSGVHNHLRGIALAGWIELTGKPRSIIIPADVMEEYGTAVGKQTGEGHG